MQRLARFGIRDWGDLLCVWQRNATFIGALAGAPVAQYYEKEPMCVTEAAIATIIGAAAGISSFVWLPPLCIGWSTSRIAYGIANYRRQ